MRNTLANPPIDERSKELWMQHAAGFTVFENIRKYAIDKINDEIVEELNTLDGDGMCMAYHDWLEDDFGEDKIIE